MSEKPNIVQLGLDPKNHQRNMFFTGCVFKSSEQKGLAGMKFRLRTETFYAMHQPDPKLLNQSLGSLMNLQMGRTLFFTMMNECVCNDLIIHYIRKAVMKKRFFDKVRELEKQNPSLQYFVVTNELDMKHPDDITMVFIETSGRPPETFVLALEHRQPALDLFYDITSDVVSTFGCHGTSQQPSVVSHLDVVLKAKDNYHSSLPKEELVTDDRPRLGVVMRASSKTDKQTTL